MAALIGGILNQNDWVEGLCGCCSNPAMCCQICCCYYCTISNMMGFIELKDGRCDWGNCCLQYIGDYESSNCVSMMTSFAMRRQLVERYGIKEESYCGSCAKGVCCFCCSYCQMQSTMQSRYQYAGGCCFVDPTQIAAVQQVGSAVKDGLGFLSDVAEKKMPQLPGQWNSTVCGCTCGECCDSCCCHCCMQGSMGGKLNANKVSGAPDGEYMDCGSCCAGCWTCCGMTYALRRELIERYNIINEPFLSSMFYSTICCPFATAQQRREMGYRGDWPGGICQSDAPSPPNVLTALMGQ